MPSSHSIHVCPLCGKPADDSYDYGPSLSCYHEPYRSVEPVEVLGVVVDGELRFPLPDVDEWKATVGAEMIAKQEKAAADRVAWMALTCEERVAKQAERRAAMSGWGLLMYDTFVDSVRDQGADAEPHVLRGRWRGHGAVRGVQRARVSERDHAQGTSLERQDRVPVMVPRPRKSNGVRPKCGEEAYTST